MASARSPPGAGTIGTVLESQIAVWPVIVTQAVLSIWVFPQAHGTVPATSYVTVPFAGRVTASARLPGIDGVQPAPRHHRGPARPVAARSSVTLAWTGQALRTVIS